MIPMKEFMKKFGFRGIDMEPNSEGVYVEVEVMPISSQQTNEKGSAVNYDKNRQNLEDLTIGKEIDINQETNYQRTLDRMKARMDYQNLLNEEIRKKCGGINI
jgi:hypothetical protein